MENLEKKVIEWAETRGIYAYGTDETRFQKLVEEVYELGVELDDEIKQEDLTLEAGDVIVTLINVIYPHGLSMYECLEAAYKKIEKRRGEIRNGFFVREE